ncbi:gliding motility-associated C-terminal domain-containing protein [Zeaxanthinibacter sp. PT1]|uniref:T9SS type B sorting domain-containing protein n=1 Tax=Zeaxanthinibacter TaxID=561554 RepID=UPI00234A337F|nr:gliding motility-associated C-terminal domain-containing protein [Zeaxanthinibacter sp. PT1]MDC6352221.1 gliding motility-associated C-terminal domain-containing protein [Zeaxanthinibacter sp. PT1]
MKRIIFCLFYLCTIFIVSAQDILVLYGGSSSYLTRAQDHAADLFATGAFDTVDAVVWDAPNKYDVNYLANYDAVMVVTNSGYNSGYGMGQALKSYVDNGGGVGIFLFANASIRIGGAWTYDALIPASQSMGPSHFGTIDIPHHPALNYPFIIDTDTWNVGNLWSSTSNTLAPEAYSIAKFSDGRPGIQARENVGVNGSGRVIGIAVSPDAAIHENKIHGYQLFANMMMWLTGAIEVTGDTCFPSNNLTFSFREEGGSPVVAYDWDFGDGNTSTQQGPSHAYAQAGIYNVTLTILREDNSSGVYSEEVVISAEPTVADAGEDQYLVSGTTTAQLLANTAEVGVGAWTLVSGPNTPNESPNDNILDLSGLVNGVYTYQWEITTNGCEPSNDQVQITIAENTAPINASISSNEILENNTVGEHIGNFSVSDPDSGDAHSYQLVSGQGDDDNASFTINGNTLQAGEIFDFEVRNVYSIRVRVTDLYGGTFESSFEIVITNSDDEDTDGDGVSDLTDNCKSIPNPDQSDADEDGQGDVCDEDDDNDGIEDHTDNCPLFSNTDQTDTDIDGMGDLCDDDDDGDGTPDENDAFPLDEAEDTDTDGDGTGDNADTDDDGDGIADENDAFPLDKTEDTDTDGDGTGNNADTDDDGDGIADENDAFPQDANEDRDTDGDGNGDNADTDDDGDGTADEDDAFPLDENEDTDTDGDGTGDNADQDDDGDGYSDDEEIALGTDPLDPADFPEEDNEPFEEEERPEVGKSVRPAQAMTPNGDGLNDSWIIPDIENYPNNTVKVYNRQGQMVYAVRGYRNNWEGHYKNNSEKLPAGSYFFAIDLGNGTPQIQGWLFINY